MGDPGAVDDFDPMEYPRRINLGCGWDRRAGYLNVDLHDFHEPDLVADIRNLDMLPSGFYDEVLAQDVLEHLPRTDALPALKEWARLLRPGGTLMLRVPDVIGIARLFATLRTREEQESLACCLFGTQQYDGDFHHNGFTELLVRHYLHDAGFHHLSFEPVDEWLFDVTAERAADAVPLVLGDLPFMDLVPAEPEPEPPPKPPSNLPSVEGQIAVAATHAELGMPLTATRMRWFKRLVLRITWVFNHHQVEHNRAVDSALRGLVDELRRDQEE